MYLGCTAHYHMALLNFYSVCIRLHLDRFLFQISCSWLYSLSKQSMLQNKNHFSIFYKDYFSNSQELKKNDNKNHKKRKIYIFQDIFFHPQNQLKRSLIMNKTRCFNTKKKEGEISRQKMPEKFFKSLKGRRGPATIIKKSSIKNKDNFERGGSGFLGFSHI